MRKYMAAFLWVVVLVLFLARENALGLVIYRWGGEALPPPSEAGSEGVDFVQLNWSALDAAQGGETFELDMDDQAIRALEYNPQVNIAPSPQREEANRSCRPSTDRHGTGIRARCGLPAGTCALSFVAPPGTSVAKTLLNRERHK